MRNKFAEIIYELALKNNKICILCADITPVGNIAKFSKKFPKQFINCGVAEQSMISIAAGLAMEGFKPFCYTIATFALFRPYEMVRIDLCYQNLPVTIIGMGSGLVYNTLGSSHQTYEDIALATALPNMQVIAPCDPLEMKNTIEWCFNISKSPTYVRLGKVGEPNLTENAIDKFEIGKIRYIKKGKDYGLISYGTILKYCLELNTSLEKKGYKNSVISCHTLKPLDQGGLIKFLKSHSKIVCIEEHVKNGGLGEKLKVIAFDNHINVKIYHYHLKDNFMNFYGSYFQLLSKHGIDLKKIENSII